MATASASVQCLVCGNVETREASGATQAEAYQKALDQANQAHQSHNSSKHSG